MLFTRRPMSAEFAGQTIVTCRCFEALNGNQAETKRESLAADERHTLGIHNVLSCYLHQITSQHFAERYRIYEASASANNETLSYFCLKPSLHGKFALPASSVKILHSAKPALLIENVLAKTFLPTILSEDACASSSLSLAKCLCRN